MSAASAVNQKARPLQDSKSAGNPSLGVFAFNPVRNTFLLCERTT